jgi:hypothetical protein
MTLEKSLRRSDACEKAMQRAYADLSRLELDPPKDVDALRTLEANSTLPTSALGDQRRSGGGNPHGIPFPATSARWRAEAEESYRGEGVDRDREGACREQPARIDWRKEE